MQGYQHQLQHHQPPPPPPPPARDANDGVSAAATRDEHPLFEAVYVVSVESSEVRVEGTGLDDASPCSSVEAYHRASRRSLPRVIWRFPSVGDTAVREEDVLKFCFPDKETIKPVRPEKFIADDFVFVVTDSTGEKAYGFCRRVLPCGPGGRYDTGRWRLPEVLCLVSRRPLFGMFHGVLAAGQALRLFQQAAPAVGAAAHDPRSGDDRGGSNKLEGLLATLLAGGVQGGRVPGPGQELLVNGLRFVRPVDEHMSQNDVPVTPLLVRLGPRNFLRLWSAILCERRIVLVAEEVRTLSLCVHAAMAILYPFAWQHVFIPLLPMEMLEYASAPMPFVIGVRKSQLDALKQQPMNDAVFVHLDSGELAGSSAGMTPIPDICDGVKEHLASATQKLDRALGKLALLTRVHKDGERMPRESSGGGSKGLTKDGINDTASALFAEVKAIHAKARKPKPGGAGVCTATATPEDHALREALVGFSIGLFGDHRIILRRQPDTSVKVDHDYFIRHRRDDRGDSEGVIRFLQEFSQSQMFHMHMMHVKDRILSKHAPTSTSTSSRGGPAHPSPATFLRVSDQLVSVRVSAENPSGGFHPTSVKRALSKVLSESLPAWSGSNAYGDPTLDPLALEVTSNAPNNKSAKLRADVCRNARESAKLSGIMRVVWARLVDCRGNKWPHAMEGLKLLKALLLSGPEGCIADALSHVPAVRRLTQYPKGWEEVVMGAADVSKAAPGIRAMAREVVNLMMDMKRLYLKREGLDNLEQVKAAKGNNGYQATATAMATSTREGMVNEPERIRLRKRRMPDFDTLHTLVGQASFGDSSNHTGGSFAGGGAGVLDDDDLDAAVTGTFFRRGVSSHGGSEGSSSGGGGGLQEFGEDMDGSVRGAWQDLAATYSLPAGGDEDEDSSDGEDGTAPGRPSYPQPPLPRRRDSGGSRDSFPTHGSNTDVAQAPAQAQALPLPDLLSSPFTGAEMAAAADQTPYRVEQPLALDENGFPIQETRASTAAITRLSPSPPVPAPPQQQQQQQHAPSLWDVPSPAEQEGRLVVQHNDYTGDTGSTTSHVARVSQPPPPPPRPQQPWPVITSAGHQPVAHAVTPPAPAPAASTYAAAGASLPQQPASAATAAQQAAAAPAGTSGEPSSSSSSSLRPSQLFAAPRTAAVSRSTTSTASSTPTSQMPPPSSSSPPLKPSQVFAAQTAKPSGSSGGAEGAREGAGGEKGSDGASAVSSVAGLVDRFERRSPPLSATGRTRARPAFGQHMLQPAARQQASASGSAAGVTASPDQSPPQHQHQQPMLSWQQQDMLRHTHQHSNDDQLAQQHAQVMQQRGQEEEQRWQQQQQQQQQHQPQHPQSPPPLQQSWLPQQQQQQQQLQPQQQQQQHRQQHVQQQQQLQPQSPPLRQHQHQHQHQHQQPWLPQQQQQQQHYAQPPPPLHQPWLAQQQQQQQQQQQRYQPEQYTSTNYTPQPGYAHPSGTVQGEGFYQASSLGYQSPQMQQQPHHQQHVLGGTSFGGQGAGGMGGAWNGGTGTGVQGGLVQGSVDEDPFAGL